MSFKKPKWSFFKVYINFLSVFCLCCICAGWKNYCEECNAIFRMWHCVKYWMKMTSCKNAKLKTRNLCSCECIQLCVFLKSIGFSRYCWTWFVSTCSYTPGYIHGYTQYKCGAALFFSLCKAEHIEDLVNLVIQEPGEEVDDKVKYKYENPFVLSNAILPIFLECYL